MVLVVLAVEVVLTVAKAIRRQLSREKQMRFMVIFS